MKLFARVNGALIGYEGMSQETIISMLAEQNLAPEFIEESVYQDELKLALEKEKNGIN